MISINNKFLKINKNQLNNLLFIQQQQQQQKREFFSKLFGKKDKDSKSNKNTLGNAIKKGELNKLQNAFEWSKLDGSDIQTAVYTIGTNNQGQLGLGDWRSETVLTFNELLKEYSVKSVKSTLLHSAAITNDNNLLTWGANFNFQIGHKYGSDTSLFPNFIESTPFSVKTSNFPNKNLIDCSIGGWSSFVYLNDPKELQKQHQYSVLAWGNNHFGQLGIDSIYNVQTPNKVKFRNENQLPNIKKISSGLYHTLILLNNGKLLSFGKLNDGQLGISNSSNNNNNIQIPTESNLVKDLNLVDVEAGYYHSIALDDKGDLYQWGIGKLKYNNSDDLQLSPTSLKNQYDGNNDDEKFKIKKINLSLSENDSIKQILGGDGISMVLTQNGKLFKIDNLSPNLIEEINFKEFKNEKIKKFSLSNTHAAVIFDAESSLNQICVWSLNDTDFELERKHSKSLFFSILQKGEKIKRFSLPNDHIIKDFSIGPHFMIVLAESNKNQIKI